MARRNLVDIDNKIMDAVIKIGSEEGIKSITSKKVAAMCGISHFTCFEHFGTRQGMLDETTKVLEKQFLSDIEELIHTEKNIVDVWNVILDRFITRPNKPLYYYYYYKEMKGELTLNSPRGQFLSNFSKKVFAKSNATNDFEYLLLWDHIVEMMFYYAEKITKGLIPNTKEVREYISKIVFNGILI